MPITLRSVTLSAAKGLSRWAEMLRYAQHDSAVPYCYSCLPQEASKRVEECIGPFCYNLCTIFLLKNGLKHEAKRNPELRILLAGASPLYLSPRQDATLHAQ